jgi:hypothetical protein
MVVGVVARHIIHFCGGFMFELYSHTPSVRKYKSIYINLVKS